MLAEQIFNAMLNSPNYFRIVYPFLDSEYFTEKHNKKIYQYFKNFYESHKSIPFCADLAVAAEGDISLSEEETKQIFTKINELKVFDEQITEEHLIAQTEKFCQDMAMEIAILAAADIMMLGTGDRGKIGEDIKKALMIQFIPDIGHDYFRDVDERLKMYIETEDKIPLDIDKLNIAMGGGLVKKSIFFFMANTGVGKCCTYDTYITIRNKITNKIERVKIGDFYNDIE